MIASISILDNPFDEALDGLIDVLFAFVAIRMLLGTVDTHDGLRS